MQLRSYDIPNQATIYVLQMVTSQTIVCNYYSDTTIHYSLQLHYKHNVTKIVWFVSPLLYDSLQEPPTVSLLDNQNTCCFSYTCSPDFVFIN